MSHVPVIDLHPFLSGRRDADMLRAVDRACRDHGFFLLTGHGLKPQIDAAWRQTRAFFGATPELKRSVERSRGNALGYFDRELTKQMRDQKEVFDYARDDQNNDATGFGHPRWPSGLPDFKPALLSYAKASARLTNQILILLYTALELPVSDIPASVGAEHDSFIRLNHYPVEDLLSADESSELKPLGDMALHHHTDPGVITLLLQDDVGGLETYSEEQGWIDVPPCPGAIVVNMSDMMQVLTNDNYRASIHRVQHVSERDRFSIVYFSLPRHDAVISPQPGLYQGTPAYDTFTWSEFISGRLGDNYADYGVDDIQISDFRFEVAGGLDH